MLKSATVNGEDAMADITFEYSDPAAMYKAVGKPYVAQEMKVLYKGEEVADTTVTVYIGVKGDTNLNGEVTADDAYEVLVYYASASVGKSASFTDGKDANLETLAYFLSDVDTEGKEGKNTDDNIIDANDAYYQLVYYASVSVNKPITWPDVIPSLKNLKGSIWAA